MPKKMRRKALFSVLSERARRGKVTIVDRLAMESISTRVFVETLESLSLKGRILMLLGKDEAADEVLCKSCRNIPGLVAREAPHLNARDALWAEEILMTSAALAQLAGGDADSAGD